MAHVPQELVRVLCRVWGVKGRYTHVHRQRKSRETGRVLAWKDAVQAKEENGFLDLRKAVKKKKLQVSGWITLQGTGAGE